MLGGCQSTYDGAMEKIGIEMREILEKRNSKPRRSLDRG